MRRAEYIIFLLLILPPVFAAADGGIVLKGAEKVARIVEKESAAGSVVKGAGIITDELANGFTRAEKITEEIKQGNAGILKNNGAAQMGFDKTVPPETVKALASAPSVMPAINRHPSGADFMLAYDLIEKEVIKYYPRENVSLFLSNLHSTALRLSKTENRVGNLRDLYFSMPEMSNIVMLQKPEEFLRFIEKGKVSPERFATKDFFLNFVKTEAGKTGAAAGIAGAYKEGVYFRGYKLGRSEPVASIPKGIYDRAFITSQFNNAADFLFNHFEAKPIVKVVGIWSYTVPARGTEPEFGKEYLFVIYKMPGVYRSSWDAPRAKDKIDVQYDDVEKDLYTDDTVLPPESQIFVFNPYALKWQIYDATLKRVK